jgi:TctA family transporter
MLRGTIIGSLCALVPAPARRSRFFRFLCSGKEDLKDTGALRSGGDRGCDLPGGIHHSSVQGDFIPTMSFGIPGDAVMALLLGALIIQGITPGPLLTKDHSDIFWGLIASFWIGNIMLVILKFPMIGIWVKLRAIPYRYLYPRALFFIRIGVHTANNDMFQVGETVVIGVVGYILANLPPPPAAPPGRMNFRLSMDRSHLGLRVRHPGQT